MAIIPLPWPQWVAIAFARRIHSDTHDSGSIGGRHRSQVAIAFERRIHSDTQQMPGRVLQAGGAQSPLSGAFILTLWAHGNGCCANVEFSSQSPLSGAFILTG